MKKSVNELKKKNGFISISVIYSFFLVFLTLLLFLVSNLVSNRVMLNSLRTQIKNDISDTNFARYLINHNEELGLIYHDASIPDGALDNSFRYIGANPDNYVCFTNTCDANNLYRIIGVINGKVKLIKYNSVGSRTFDTNGSNSYVNSAMFRYLNNDFLTSISSFGNLIEPTTWYVGGLDSTFASKKVYEIYTNELGTSKNSGVTVNVKIGLPYISDYAYAGAKDSYSSTVKNTSNWMFTSEMWSISRVTTYINQVYYIRSDGILSADTVDKSKAVRPTFFLKNSTRYLSGNGTSTDPYKVG